MNTKRLLTVTRTDLKQLVGAKDYWIPMMILGSLFFVILPTILLSGIVFLSDAQMTQQIADTLDALPQSTQGQLLGDTPEGRAGYALAVFLFAPMAVVVPITISTAVGASTLVGERERGTGEFLAHSPATAKEIYLGKLLASIIPGYLTTIIGFGAYSLIVNLIVGPKVGGWFFPTANWWLMMLWIVPPFLALVLSIVLRLSARVKSTAAAQQASGLVSLPLIGIAYGQASGSIFGSPIIGLSVGAVAWSIALVSLYRGVSSVTRARLLGVGDQV